MDNIIKGLLEACSTAEYALGDYKEEFVDALEEALDRIKIVLSEFNDYANEIAPNWFEDGQKELGECMGGQEVQNKLWRVYDKISDIPLPLTRLLHPDKCEIETGVKVVMAHMHDIRNYPEDPLDD